MKQETTDPNGRIVINKITLVLEPKDIEVLQLALNEVKLGIAFDTVMKIREQIKDQFAQKDNIEDAIVIP